MSATTHNNGETSGPVLTETPEELAYELRAAEGSIWTGTRLAIGIGVFAFASLAFAYFYLRSNNAFNLWRPRGITAPTSFGAAVMAFTLAAAALAVLASRRLRGGQTTDWQVAGWAAVLSGLIAFALQIWEQTQLPFYPGSSGYASCYTGWAVMNMVLILGGIYWSETLLARFMRLRRAFTEEGGAAGSPLPAARLFRANVEGAASFWIFVAVTEVFFWLLFYMI